MRGGGHICTGLPGEIPGINVLLPSASVRPVHVVRVRRPFSRLLFFSLFFSPFFPVTSHLHNHKSIEQNHTYIFSIWESHIHKTQITHAFSVDVFAITTRFTRRNHITNRFKGGTLAWPGLARSRRPTFRRRPAARRRALGFRSPVPTPSTPDRDPEKREQMGPNERKRKKR
jgi:hypothetical protein